jgi:3-phosphoglycerate kinase
LYPYYYRPNAPSTSGKAIVRLLKQWNVKKIALVQTLDPKARTYAREVISEASKAKITILTNVRISPSDQANVALKKTNPNYDLFKNHYNELKRVDAR